MPTLTKRAARALSLSLVAVLIVAPRVSSGQPRLMDRWETDWDKRSVDLSEIMSGGVPRDGIPPVDEPRFVSVRQAAKWVGQREPVIMLVIGTDARAYPLQILTYHEIVNDVVDERPVAVTFCPLCYSAIVFDRLADGRPLDFGVSGMLRNSDLIMYDRQTQSLWQQIEGEAIVGTLTGTRLEPIAAQIVSFRQFADRYPSGRVLSRETGHTRPYGTNPYEGYDDISKRPFLYRGDDDDRLPPMEKVITVSIGSVDKAYPHSVTRTTRVINDRIAGRPVLVVHGEGATTALGDAIIKSANEVGTTGVFDREVDGTELTFESDGKTVRDIETGSSWDVTGRSLSGKLAGKQLRLIPHGNYFAFAWFAFKPKTEIYRGAAGG